MPTVHVPSPARFQGRAPPLTCETLALLQMVSVRRFHAAGRFRCMELSAMVAMMLVVLPNVASVGARKLQASQLQPVSNRC